MKSLRQFLVCAIVISAFVAVYSLEDASDPKGNVQIADASASDMARRRRHRFGHHLWLGGIHAIGALVAIKFKLVLIFLAVMGTVFYGYKIYSGSSCPTPVVSEHGAPFLPFEGYSSSFPGIISSSYPGSDPYSAYSADHGTVVGAEVASSPGPYRRTGGSTKRSAEDNSSFDFSELAFTVLGVDSKECRKRFICEMSVNYNRNPIVGTAYKMISSQFFPAYAKEIDQKAPKSIKDCATLYSGCRGPNDPIPEETNNAVDESINSKAVVINVTEEEESRAMKPKLDQVQRFVVGSQKTQ